MRAVVTRSSGSETFVLAEVDDPTPGASEALVRGEAFSLNLGEVRRAITQPADGWRPGWDFAGVVEPAAADGSGPPVSHRVLGAGGEGASGGGALKGGWGEGRGGAQSRQAEPPPNAGAGRLARMAETMGGRRGKPALGSWAVARR